MIGPCMHATEMMSQDRYLSRVSIEYADYRLQGFSWWVEIKYLIVKGKPPLKKERSSDEYT